MLKVGYNDDKKKEYFGRLAAGVIVFLLKKAPVIPEEIAKKIGEEIGSFISGIELISSEDGSLDEHWNNALNKSWRAMKCIKSIDGETGEQFIKYDFPEEFWHPLEKNLFRGMDTIVEFFDNRQVENQIPIYEYANSINKIIEKYHKNSDNIDTQTIPDDFAKDFLSCLDEEIRRNAILQNRFDIIFLHLKIKNHIFDSIEQDGSYTLPVPYKLTTIPAPEEVVGRKDDIIDIYNLIESKNIVCLCAEGGIGKTALAKTIVDDIRRNKLSGNNYKHIAWISSTGNLKADLIKLGLPEMQCMTRIEDKVAFLIKYLQSVRAFLVIDGIEAPLTYEEIDILNTIAGRTKILITSRVEIPVFEAYQLNILSYEDSLLVFYRYFLAKTEDKPNNYDQIKKRDDIHDAELIIKYINCNTLFIELIAKTASVKHADLHYIYEQLKIGSFYNIVDTNVFTMHERKYGDKQHTLEEQLRKLYEIAKLTESQREIMILCSFFPAEHNIFFDVFNWAGLNKDVQNDFIYLEECGWIKKTTDGYQIQKTVKTSIEQQRMHDKIVFSIEKYSQLIAELEETDQYIYPSMEYNKVRERIVIPETICKLSGESGSVDVNVLRLLISLASLCYEYGMYEDALEYYNKSLNIKQRLIPLDNYIEAVLYNNIALAYYAIGENECALYYYKKSGELYENYYGTECSGMITTYSNLSALACSQGDYEKAREYIEKALEICNRNNVGSNEAIVAIYNNYGHLFLVTGRFEEALIYLKKALLISKEVFGEDHPIIGTFYNNIGGVYHNQEKHIEALKYYKKGLVIRKHALGNNHPYTAISYDNIAGAYNDLGNSVNALEYYKKAISAFEKGLGTECKETMTAYNNFAIFCKKHNHLEESIEFFEKALSIEIKLLGRCNPDTVETWFNLGDVNYALGRYDESLKNYNLALTHAQSLSDIEDDDAIIVYTNLTDIFLKQENYEEAIESGKILLKRYKKGYGRDRRNLAIIYNNIAYAFSCLGKHEQALDYNKKALSIRKSELGDEHADTAVSYFNIAGVYFDQGNYARAQSFYKKAVYIREKLYGNNHLLTAKTYNNLAGAYHAEGVYKKAHKYYKKALYIRRKALGDDNIDTATVYHNLGILYLQMEKYAKSRYCLKKALSTFELILSIDDPKIENTRGEIQEIEKKIKKTLFNVKHWI